MIKSLIKISRINRSDNDLAIKKKIIFFGLGSIGSRHLRLIKKNFDYDIYAYRSQKDKKASDITNIYDLEEVFKINPDIAFITNPTNLHIETALFCLKAGIKNIFIEKPLSNSLRDLDQFLKKAENQGNLVYVGYVMRYNPVLIRLKEIVDKYKNQIFYSQTRCCSYLPDWRPGIDYRDTYSSTESEGGGVILDISHEFDYNEWLFGKIKSIHGDYGKISNLEIDAEDFCDAYLKFETGINASIHIDFFSLNIQRKIRVITPNEEFAADLINNEIIKVSNQGKDKEIFNFERDYMYEQQLKYFFDCVEKQDKKINNFKDTALLLQKLLEFKREEMINFNL